MIRETAEGWWRESIDFKGEVDEQIEKLTSDPTVACGWVVEPKFDDPGGWHDPRDADKPTLAGHEEVLTDHRRLVRELDVAMHGQEGAALQASLCDLIGPARRLREENERLRRRWNITLTKSDTLVSIA